MYSFPAVHYNDLRLRLKVYAWYQSPEIKINSKEMQWVEFDKYYQLYENEKDICSH